MLVLLIRRYAVSTFTNIEKGNYAGSICLPHCLKTGCGGDQFSVLPGEIGKATSPDCMYGWWTTLLTFSCGREFITTLWKHGGAITREMMKSADRWREWMAKGFQN